MAFLNSNLQLEMRRKLKYLTIWSCAKIINGLKISNLLCLFKDIQKLFRSFEDVDERCISQGDMHDDGNVLKHQVKDDFEEKNAEIEQENRNLVK
jgi:hypothetical protein